MKRAAFLASAVLAACASTPAAHYYVLEAVPARARTADSSLQVLVDPVSIPEEVDRPQIVLALEDGEITIDDAHRWAAPLQPEITQVLARNLGTTLGSNAVTTDTGTAPWKGYRVHVRILELRSRLGHEADIEARWEVGLAGTMRRGTTRVQQHAGVGYEGLAQAHSRALAQLASAIAADLRAIEAD